MNFILYIQTPEVESKVSQKEVNKQHDMSVNPESGFKEIKYFNHSHELPNEELLKASLTKENYKQKFHQLLCCEEEEHKKILRER